MKTFSSFSEWAKSGAAPDEIREYPSFMWDRIMVYLEDDHYDHMDWPEICEWIGYDDLGVCADGGMGF